jgi:hypothetical protein
MTFLERTESIAVAGRGGVGSGKRGQNRMTLPRATRYRPRASCAVPGYFRMSVRVGGLIARDDEEREERGIDDRTS